ncbi:hypothetical protein DFP72DRAFT_202742 [Ephemerocybe angulata]|uniref:Uncharacterized protein n=1 Tax=Ephemerocybe angulata TaxID=980116 RepID=A0A8H6IH27_9AGAR|nr:hypothetical protein DFP72DRAFT_202742 [Tulosesus angulatus]
MRPKRRRLHKMRRECREERLVTTFQARKSPSRWHSDATATGTNDDGDEIRRRNPIRAPALTLVETTTATLAEFLSELPIYDRTAHARRRQLHQNARRATRAAHDSVGCWVEQEPPICDWTGPNPTARTPTTPPKPGVDPGCRFGTADTFLTSSTGEWPSLKEDDRPALDGHTGGRGFVYEMSPSTQECELLAEK